MKRRSRVLDSKRVCKIFFVNGQIGLNLRQRSKTIAITDELLDELIMPYFAYLAPIRKTRHNALESLNMTLRKVTKNRGSFPKDEALFKLLYLALTNISKNGLRG